MHDRPFSPARRMAGRLAVAAIAGAPVMPPAIGAQLPPDLSGRHASEEWYLPVADGCRLYVYEVGRGRDTLVVLHGGWGAEHSYLLEPFAGLETRYRLVFYDQRGSLRSPCPDSAVSVARHVADLERLRGALGLRRMTLVGHSNGTYLAMRYLQENPAAAGGLVLLAAVAPSDPKTAADSAAFERHERARRAFLDRPEIAAQLRKEGLDKDTSQMSAKERTRAWRIRFAGANVYHVDRWRQMKGGQAFFSRNAAVAAARTAPRAIDFRPALAAHTCPVTFISGDHDLGDVAAVLGQLLAGIPNVRLEVIASAGHNIWIDAPAQFRELLLAALERGTRCR